MRTARSRPPASVGLPASVIRPFPVLFRRLLSILCFPPVPILLAVACAKPYPHTAVIVAFSDSTTAPRQVDGQTLAVYPAVLQRLLLERGIGAAVVNAGVPGNTTEDARARFETEVIGRRPDLVIIQFGLNDSAVDLEGGETEPRVSRERYEENLTWFVRRLKEQDIGVILMTPNPGRWTPELLRRYGRPPYHPADPWGFNVLNTTYAGSVRRIARSARVPLVDVYRSWEEYDAIEGCRADDLLLDGRHPGDRGHQLMADMLAGAIEGLRLDPQPRRGYSIPLVDLASETDRRVVVDREPGQYLGHPTTVLLEDGRTLICVYPKGHGRGAIVMKRSGDGGLTWSERLPVPENWATSQEVPTIHRVVDPAGVRRLIMFSGLYPIRMAVSGDDGRTWSPLEPIGDFGGIVAMGSVARMADGSYRAWFHDDGRFIHEGGAVGPDLYRFHVYGIRSVDGGLTWSRPEVIATHPVAHLCEPGFVRSPDGGTIALLLRENSRRMNSFVIFSTDAGASWSEPRELPGALTGDRHTARYAPDGRLFISFRDTTHESPTRGDWVGWVGTWDDLAAGREGEYRVRLMNNLVNADCAYPAVELLPDGTFVATTYGHWTEGEQPWIVSVRFRMEELDALADHSS